MTSNVPQVPSTSFLTDLIPYKQRKIVYALYGLTGALIGAISLAVSAINGGLPPKWLIIVLVVYNFVAPFFSSLAGANAKPTGTEAAESVE